MQPWLCGGGPHPRRRLPSHPLGKQRTSEGAAADACLRENNAFLIGADFAYYPFAFFYSPPRNFCRVGVRPGLSESVCGLNAACSWAFTRFKSRAAQFWVLCFLANNCICSKNRRVLLSERKGGSFYLHVRRTNGSIGIPSNIRS